jgi:ribose transport system permease protein
MTTETAPTAASLPQQPMFARGKHLVDSIGAQNTSLLVALALLVAYIGSQTQTFFLTANLLNIGAAVALLGIVSLPQTVTIISGGLDVSIGAIVGLASVACAKAAGSGITQAVIIATAVGAAAGLFNGLVIRYGRVNPIITTLATFTGFQGVTFIVTDAKAIGVTDKTLLTLGSGKFLGVPNPLVVLIVAAAVFWFALRYTAAGRRVYAIGGNELAARVAGIRLSRYTLGVYTLAGLMGGIAGVLLTARTGAGLANSGAPDLSLQSITAVLLGGAALTGGRGSVVGTMLAVLLLGVLQNGLTLLDVAQFYQLVAQGALLILAVAIQEFRAPGMFTRSRARTAT